MKFQHISARQLLLDSFRLGKAVYETGFRPKHAISVWRGGTPVGLGVNAFFRNQGLNVDHTTIATESYTGIGNAKEVIVKGLEHLIRIICPEDKLLIVDDVYERGETIRAIIQTLREQARANCPREIVVATIHRKPDKMLWSEVPIISLYDVEADVWIDYPHELADLVTDDPEDPFIRQKDPRILETLHQEVFREEEIIEQGSFKYIDPDELLLDAFKLGKKVFQDDSFLPDYLVALWPGGIEVGLPIHEAYKYLNKKSGNRRKLPDHISINTIPTYRSYKTEILGIEYLAARITKDDNILIVDSTFRSGQVVNDALIRLKEALRRNLNHRRVKVASLYWNPDDCSTWTVRPEFTEPDYFLKKINVPVIYPNNVHRLPNPYVDLKQLFPELHEILYR